MTMITLACPSDAVCFTVGQMLGNGAGEPLGIIRFRSIDRASGTITSSRETAFEASRVKRGKRYIGPTRFSFPATQRRRMFREMGIDKYGCC